VHSRRQSASMERNAPEPMAESARPLPPRRVVGPRRGRAGAGVSGAALTTNLLAVNIIIYTILTAISIAAVAVPSDPPARSPHSESGV